MKKINLKKIATLVLLFSFMLVQFIGVTAKAEAIPTERKYVALGDSIAVGLSAAPGLGYTDILAGYLKTIDESVVFNNLGQNGYTSTDLLNLISQKQAEIASSEIITISIGGNNFLKPTIIALATALRLDPTSPTLVEDIEKALASLTPQQIQQLFTAIAADPTFKAAIGQGLATLNSDFPKIIAAIKALAPTAKIYINNLYNPIAGNNPVLTDLYNMYEGICSQVNPTLAAGSAVGGVELYKVIDVYSLFKADTSTVNFTLDNVDPHPTQQGHNVIAEAIAKVVDFKAPEPPVEPEVPEISVDTIKTTSTEIVVKTTPGYYVFAGIMPDTEIGIAVADEDGYAKIPVNISLKAGDIITVVVGNETVPLNYKEVTVVDGTLPTFKIEGIEEGKVYDKAVTPKIVLDDSEDTVVALLNGKSYNFEAISEDGKYNLVITVTDKNGNEAKLDINFEIKKQVVIETPTTPTTPTIPTDNKVLPQTGGVSSVIPTILGLISIGSGIGVSRIRRSK